MKRLTFFCRTNSRTTLTGGFWLVAWLVLGMGLLSRASSPLFAQELVQKELEAMPPLDIVILLDESYSMWSETDPKNRRGDALEMFVNALSVDQTSSEFRVAIVTFGTSAEIIGDGFYSIKNEYSRQSLLTAFQAQHTNKNGWTNVLDGLKKARELFKTHSFNAKPIIVMLTDGTPETPDANKDQPVALKNYLEEIKAFSAEQFDEVVYAGDVCPLSTIGTPIYTVALRGANAVATYSEEERLFWQTISSLTGGGYEEILPANDTEFQQRLQAIFFEMLRDWTCVQVDQPQFVALPHTQTLSLTPAQSQIFIQIAKNSPDVQLQILDPTGKPVLPTDEFVTFVESPNGLNQSWGIGRPNDLTNWSGNWVINLQPGATTPSSAQLTTYTVNDTVRLEMEQPTASILPIGSAVSIRAAILDKKGNPYPPDAVSQLVIQLNAPDGSSQVIEGNVSADGAIEAVSAPLMALGRYVIEMSATTQSGGQPIVLTQRKNIDVGMLPWLKVTEPTNNAQYYLGQPLKISADLMLGTERYTDELGKQEVVAELYEQTENLLIRDYSLNKRGDLPNHFEADLPPLSPVGSYLIRLLYKSTPLGGQEYAAPPIILRVNVLPPLPTATVVPTVTPLPTMTPTPFPSPTPTRTPLFKDVNVPPSLFFLCGSLALLPLFGLMVVVFLKNRPNLSGAYLEDMTHSGNDLVFDQSYFGRMHTVYSRNGETVAKLHFQAGEDGTRVEVRYLNPLHQLHYSDHSVEEGDIFYPRHNEIIRVGDVVLRYDHERDE